MFGLLENFVHDLALTRAPGGAFNPWGEHDADMDIGPVAPADRRGRLLEHLAVWPALILVGEAPGYQGCRYSGVPFTSERLILEGLIPRVNMDKTLYERITRREKPWSEPSATIVWNVLHDLGIHETTVLWNAFPFHPHREGEPLSNATPTVEQLLAGREWLRRFLTLPNFVNAAVLPVGKKAAAMLEGWRWFPATLRHPANGGARVFAEGLANYVRAMR